VAAAGSGVGAPCPITLSAKAEILQKEHAMLDGPKRLELP
jgi:hypothetical protein